MLYQNLTLNSKIYKINVEDNFIQSLDIYGLRIHCKFNGKTEEKILDKSYLEVSIREGSKTLIFALKEDGEIIESLDEYCFSERTAEEELIIHSNLD